MKTWLPLTLTAILAAGGGFAAYHWMHGSGAGTAVAPGTELAADIALLPLAGGEPESLSKHRGKLVLVNFWATWCAPCLKEIPLLVDAQTHYGARGLQILGPALDDPEQVKQMLGRLKIQYPVYTGETEIPAAMDALGDTLGALPFSVLISTDGYVLQRKHGEFTAEELDKLIEAHLPSA